MLKQKLYFTLNSEINAAIFKEALKMVIQQVCLVATNVHLRVFSRVHWLQQASLNL